MKITIEPIDMAACALETTLKSLKDLAYKLNEDLDVDFSHLNLRLFKRIPSIDDLTDMQLNPKKDKDIYPIPMELSTNELVAVQDWNGKEKIAQTKRAKVTLDDVHEDLIDS